VRLTTLGIPLGGLACLAGCQSAGEAPGESARDAAAPVAESTSAPMHLGDAGTARTNWEYLLGKYDANGDGRVEPAEYLRDGERFARLDLDEDGVLSAADFPEVGADSFRGRYRRQRGLRVLGQYFQADEETGELVLDELEWMLTTYDANLDEVLTAEEFADASDEYFTPIEDGDASGTERSMMGDLEPWPVLLEAADADGDGRLAASEVLAFFHANDDGDRVLSLRLDAEPAAEDASGIAPGQPAADFTLPSPSGDSRVSLASFRGSKPVALVFGSYT